PSSDEPVPGTGPYRIVSLSTHEIRFSRNLHFKEWNAAAQPDGYPDEIVWKVGQPSHEAVVSELERGTSDWTFDLVPPSRLAAVRRRSPAQVHINPWYLFEYIALNPHAAPFDDLRVRQALNYAIDRRAIVAMYGGEDVANASCQVLVPG